MIQEKTIAKIFAVILLIGIFCVGYVILTQPIGMITYQTHEEPIQKTQKEKIPREEMIEIFEEHWEEAQNQLIILGEELEKE